jgi:hypothetical protein
VTDSAAIAGAAANDSNKGARTAAAPAQSSVGTEMQLYPCK